MSLRKPDYISTLNDLKEKIRQARIRASVIVNTELLKLYWEIGNTILSQQKHQGWGAKVIDTLAADLKVEFPDFRGLSVRNLKYMRAFAEAYPTFSTIVQPAAAQIGKKGKPAIVQPPLAQIPWTHHLVILDKCKDPNERLFYIQKTVQNGWSKSILAHQIESKLYIRNGKAITNFEDTLPSPQSDLARESFKNPYVFDFLAIEEEMQERELEKALIAHMREFMLALGKGFAYVGNQYHLDVADDDYFLDLLFFNYQLNCFVIFELKVGQFKPEYAGKLNFYITTVNEKIKTANHNPTIGILLCKTPNKTVVEYALGGVKNPLGVADYELSKALPKKLKSDLPTVEELEKEMEKGYEELQKPIDKKLQRIKELVGGLKQPEVKEKRNAATCERVLKRVVLPLRDLITKQLGEKNILNEFEDADIVVWTDGQGHVTDKGAKDYLKQRKEVNEFRVDIRLKGFKAAGTKAFSLWKDIIVFTEIYNYLIAFSRNRPQDAPLIDKLYHQLPTEKEFDLVVDGFLESILDDITQHLERITKESK